MEFDATTVGAIHESPVERIRQIVRVTGINPAAAIAFSCGRRGTAKRWMRSGRSTQTSLVLDREAVDEELVEVQDTSSVVCRLRHWTPFPRWGRLGLRPAETARHIIRCTDFGLLGGIPAENLMKF